MTLRLPRLRAPDSIVDGQGRPSIPFIQWWQEIAEELESANTANDERDATLSAALDIINDALERANAAYGVLGPGSYEFTASDTVPDDCRTALVDCTSGAVTLTLNPVADCISDIIFVKVDASANAMTVDGDGAETISGSATKSTSTQWATIKVRPTPTYWVQI